MVDLLLELDGSGTPDLQLEAGDLVLDRGLRTPVLCSLYSDARASAEQLVSPNGDPRGWWAEDPGSPWGSLLWTLSRAVATAATLNLAESYAREALDWLRLEEIVESVDVVATFEDGPTLCLSVVLTRGTARRWQELWTGEAERAAELPGLSLRFLAR